MLASLDSNEIFDIEIDLIPKNSYLHKLLSNDTEIPIKKTKEGAVIVNNTSRELAILKNYIMEGEVSDNIIELLNLLDYYGIYCLKTTYPEDFVRIKLKEDWYRNNLYNRKWDKNAPIKDNEYNLICLDEEIVNKFELINLVHYLYSRKIYGKKIKQYRTVDHLIQKDRINQFEVEELEIPQKRFLLHSYPRRYIQGKEEQLIEKIKIANEKFLTRDAEFNHHIIREALRTRRSGVSCNDHIWNKTIKIDYKEQFDKIMSRLRKNWLIKCLTDHNCWNNLLLAGGSILNKVINCELETDYDLFIYGLTPEEANAKLNKIITLFEHKLYSINRSENALTINLYSRELQIILRLYQTKAEILQSFDVDSCCIGYDGQNVLMTPRCLYSLSSMINMIDFDRMSPSYEYRLAKYMTRGFSVYVPDFNWLSVNRNKMIEYDLLKVEMKHKINQKYSMDHKRSIVQILPNRSPSLSGLEILIYHYYHQINPATVKSRSDYGNSGKRLDAKSASFPSTEFTFGLDRNGKIISYTFRPKIINGRRTIPINLIFNLDIKDFIPFDRSKGGTQKPDLLLELKLSNTLTWKVINPGEQTTSTFHRLVLDDIDVWYKSRFS